MSANTTYPDTLTVIINNISFITNAVTIIIGTLGGICNFITYTAPQFTRNACVFYLMCANSFQMISLLVPVTIRVLVGYLGDALERQSVVFCKFRYYVAFNIPHLATVYMVLSILDRCLATSSKAKLRAWSQHNVAIRVAFFTFIFTCLFNLHILILQNIYNDKCQSPLNKIYSIYFVVHTLFFISLLPHLIMLVLCLMTFVHIKQTKARIAPTTTPARNTLMRRFEIQLITILITQAIVGTVFVMLRVGGYCYTLLTRNQLNKSVPEVAGENFIVQLGVALYYLNFGIMFYISALTSKYFRETFIKRSKEIIHHFRRQYH